MIDPSQASFNDTIETINRGKTLRIIDPDVQPFSFSSSPTTPSNSTSSTPTPSDFTTSKPTSSLNSSISPTIAERHTLLRKPPSPELFDLPASDQPSFPQPLNPHILHVGIVGAANAGKSTLLNHLMMQKVSAVSPKAQTTRGDVLAVLTRDNVQLVFRDTAGIARNAKQRADLPSDLARSAFVNIDQDEAVLAVVDAAIALNQSTLDLVRGLREAKREDPGKRLILVLNKSDLVESREQVLYRMKAINQDGVFDAMFSVSAAQHKHLDDLADHLFSLSRPGLWEYPPECGSLQSPAARALEAVREKIFRRVSQEVPYGTSLELVGWTDLADGSLRIDVDVYVSKKGHEKILIGAKGRNFSIIKASTEAELQHIWGRVVKLNLVARGVRKPNQLISSMSSEISSSQLEQKVYSL